MAAFHRDIRQELRNLGGRVTNLREDPVRYGVEIRKLEERINELQRMIERSGGSLYSN